MKADTIAFIGCGNMAASLINGLVSDGYDPANIWASDPEKEQLSRLAASHGIRIANSNHDAVDRADILVLAVKPQVLEEVARSLSDSITTRAPLVISIAAGVRENDLRRWLGDKVSLVRSMPNTPAMIQTGATVLYAGPEVSKEQKDAAESILRAVGLTQWVEDESLMDTVTALSGSGPAYFFLIMEILEKSASELGLEPETARILTLQTALGAARMAMASSESTAKLRERVTSPGGTTEKALKTLEEGEIRALFKQALTDAHDRSIELSQLLGDL